MADLKALAEKEAAEHDAQQAEGVDSTPQPQAEQVEQPEAEPEVEVDRSVTAAEYEHQQRLAEEQRKVAEIKKAEEAPDEYVVRREIVVDGQVEVFEGRGASEKEAYDDFIAKLTEGKRAANKHIRTLEREAANRKSEAEVAQRREDEHYVAMKRLEREPLKVIDEAIEKKLAAKQAADQAENERQQRGLRAQEIWVSQHPEYIPNQENGTQIRDAVVASGAQEFSVEAIEQAFQQLKAAGKLALKGVARSVARSSSISTNRSSAPVVKELSEDDLYAMPLHELKARANQALAENPPDEGGFRS